MAVNKIGTSVALPPGAISRVGSGFTASGYGSLEGSFPAGKYLIRSTAPCSVSFGTNYDSRDFSTGSSLAGDRVIETKYPTRVFEYISSLPIVLNAGTNIPGASNVAAALAGNFTNSSIDAFSSSFQVGRNYTNSLAGSSFNTPPFPYRDHFFTWIGSGTTTKYKSKDLINWTSIGGATDLPTASIYDSKMYATNGDIAVIVNNGTIYYNTSPLTNAAWSSYSTLGTSGSKIIYGKGIFLVYGGTTGYYSTNGTTWTSCALPTTSSTATMAYQNGVFLAANSANRDLWYSYDGLTWTYYTAPFTYTGGNFGSVAAGNGLFLAVGSSNASVASHNGYGTWWSTDGINWNRGQNPPYSYTSTTANSQPDIVFLGNHFLFTLTSSGFNPHISMDGTYWRKVNDYNEGASHRAIYYAQNTRGFLVGNSSSSNHYLINMRQPNCYFEVYLLDSSVKTFL